MCQGRENSHTLFFLRNLTIFIFWYKGKEATCQEKEVSASSRAQSLHLNSNSGNSPGSATCSCLSFLQLIFRLLLFKVAFGKCFMVYFVTYHMLYPCTQWIKRSLGADDLSSQLCWYFSISLWYKEGNKNILAPEPQKQGCRRCHTNPGRCRSARSWWAQAGVGEHSCCACLWWQHALPVLCCQSFTGAALWLQVWGSFLGERERRFIPVGWIYTKTQSLVGGKKILLAQSMENSPEQYFIFNLLLFFLTVTTVFVMFHCTSIVHCSSWGTNMRHHKNNGDYQRSMTHSEKMLTYQKGTK